MLPLILAMTFTSITAATFITKMGMPTYVMASGTILACIGSGLVYTIGIDTPSSNWIGYLVLLGFGYGFTLQLGIIVGQASSKPEDIAVTTAAINCMTSRYYNNWRIVTQTYGGALFVSVAQNIFSNKLIQGVQTSVPDVDPQIVISAGATDLRAALTPDQLQKVLVIFMSSLKDAFIVPIALTGTAFFLVFLLTKNMRVKGGIKLAAA
jgi:MFS transporter, DHA2 family, glioxin efflux transporter